MPDAREDAEECRVSRRDFLKITGGAGAAMAAMPLLRDAAAAEGPAERPNIVFIFADDLGWHSLGCTGATWPFHTPNIDALAREGVRATNAYVTAAVCAASRAGMLTGQYQERFGYYTNDPFYAVGTPAGLACLAEPLQQAGYNTGIVGKWHMGIRQGQHPLDRGFDYWFGFDHWGDDYYKPRRLYRNRSKVEPEGYLTDVLTEDAVEFIDRQKDRSEPFFLYLSHFAVHRGQQIEIRDGEPTSTGVVPQAPPRYRDIFDTLKGDPSEADHFLGMLRALDDSVGRVMQALREAGLDENTLVIFSSDNGGDKTQPEMANGPLRGCKRTLWEGGLRVPLVARWPGRIPADSRTDALISTLDLFPTFAGLAGAELPEDHHLDGIDIMPALEGRDRRGHEHLFFAGRQHDKDYWGKGHFRTAPSGWAVRQGDWKLFRVRPDEAPRLYNLAEDIGETTDVADQNPGVVRRLLGKYRQWIEPMPEPLGLEEMGRWQEERMRLYHQLKQ